MGKAKSLRDRVASYFASTELLPKTAKMMSEAVDLSFQVVESEIDALLLEANYIRKLAPRFNVDWKDGKAYPHIEITVKDLVPQVSYVRAETNPQAQYFGPYPTGSDLLGLLRFLRRVFPYVSQKHPKNRPCLRSHLGLCPCPAVYTDRLARLRYRRDLKSLVKFLEGKRQVVQKRLEREMHQAAKNQEYERAGELKTKLEQISYVVSPRTLPWEYESNPNLASDRRAAEITELKAKLGLTQLTKIECYDISNTFGQDATGAQVVFVDGVADKNLYRRYKIKLKRTPDDFAMMKEMVSRRLNSKIPLPELMVIDGGMGQLGVVLTAFKEQGITPPKVIGLAKKLETIILPGGETIQLGSASPALQLLQRLRDEAHRFSRRYHFYLRSRRLLAK